MNQYLGEDEAEKLCHVLNIMYHTFMTWQGYYDNRNDLHNWGWYAKTKRELFKNDVVDGKRILEISLREIHCAANWQSIAQYKQHHVCVLGQYVPEDGPRAGDIWGGPRVIDFAKGYNCLPVATSDVEEMQCMALHCTDNNDSAASNSAATNNPYTILPLSDFGTTTQEAKCIGAFEQWNPCASTAQPEGDELCNPVDDSDDTISITMCHERCECEPGYKYNSNMTDAVCVNADYCNIDEDTNYMWNRYDSLGDWRENTAIAMDLKAAMTHKTLLGANGDGKFSTCWDVKQSENSKARIPFGSEVANGFFHRMPCYQAMSAPDPADRVMYNQCTAPDFLKNLDLRDSAKVILQIVFKHNLKMFLLGDTKSLK